MILVRADNQKLEAHKVILSGSSNVFRNMLLGEKHPNPLIFMAGVEHEVLKALLDLLYSGEAELREEKKESFEKLSADIQLFGVTNVALEKPKTKEKTRICKYWNRGFCKKKVCTYFHTKEDCEEHLVSENCREKLCHKRHRRTCKYWKQDECKRGRHCAYLHRYTNAKRPDSSQPEKSNETVIEDMDEDDRFLMECEALVKM